MQKAAFFVLAVLIGASVAVPADDPPGQALEWKAGVASAMITPDRPLQMAGYAGRKEPAEGAEQDLFAKALALQDGQGHRVVIITMDLIGIIDRLRDDVARRVEEQYKLSPIDNLAQKYWDQYSVRKFQMLSETNRTIAPWTIIRSDNKKQARLNCMKFVLSNMSYANKLPDEELQPDPEITISGIEELRHMEENLMQPHELRG